MSTFQIKPRRQTLGIRLTLALTLALVALPSLAFAADDVEALVAQALEENRSIVVLRARIAALQKSVHKASAWLDPRFSVEYSNMPIDAWRPGKHPMSGIQFKLSQTFYYPGKVAAREAVAEGRVRVTRANLAEQKVQLRAAVRRAYVQLGLVRQLRKVTTQHIKLVDQFLGVVKVKYEVGKAGQHDFIRLQVLEKKLRDDLKTFDRDAKALSATINATLHRRTDIAISTPEAFAVLDVPAKTETLAHRAKTERPALRRLGEEARTRQAAARRAAREGYPDITAWLGYRLRLASGGDQGTDFVGLGFSIPLPFSYATRSGSERDKQRELARATLALRATRLDEIRGRLAATVARWRRAAQKATTYTKTLMPLAHRALDATFAAYQVDRADFASLFQAELQLLDFARAIVRAVAATHLAEVSVEALIGARLRSFLRKGTPK